MTSNPSLKFRVSCEILCRFTPSVFTYYTSFLSLDEGANDGLVARFTADVTCMDISNDKGEFLAAGSADMTVKVINTSSYVVIATFEGHLAPILSVSLDNSGANVATSSCDGTTKIWSVQEKKQIKSFQDIVPKSNDFSNSSSLAGVAWKPGKENTDILAVAYKNNVTIVQNKGGSISEWVKIKELKPKTTTLKMNEYISVLAFSKSENGSYLVAGTTKGNIFVWHTTSGDVILETKSTSDHEYPICSIDYCPMDNSQVSFINSNGYWGTVKDIPVLEKSKHTTKKEAKSKVEKSVKPSSKVRNEDELNEDELAAALFEDDDDDNENSFSIRKIKAETGFLNDEDSMDKIDAETASAFGDNDKDDDTASVVDQMVAGVKANIEGEIDSKLAPPKSLALDFDIQEPFQPGSTPVHLHSRFMLWNSVGIVKSYRSEDEKSVDVEFHDTAIHHPIHLSNVRGYSMAALSSKCLILASAGDEEDYSDDENTNLTSSKLLCHYFGSSDVNKEWSLDMPKKEEIMAVACGDDWLAVATDRRNLRMYSCGGMQLEIISLPGPVVALAGYKKEIIISVQIGMPLPGNQAIGIQILTVGGKRHRISNISLLPLAPKSTLSWIGFTDQGTPCAMDSAGFVRLLNFNYGSAGWQQICDTKALVKGKSDHYFLVGVNEHAFTARAILVKGSRYPQTVPRPVVAVLPLSLPLCTSSVGEKDVLESEYWTASIKARTYESGSFDLEEEASSNRDGQMQCLVKLFALACKSDHESRAIEICKLMDLPTIQIAIQYASKIRRMQLATKISDLAGNRQEEEIQKQEQKIADNNKFKCYSEDAESQDMFMATQDDNLLEEIEEKTPTNPFLAAKFRKQNSYSAQSRLQSMDNDNSPDIGDNRNPFKKNNLTPQSGAIRSGLVFDGMSNKPGTAKGTQSNHSTFGSRPPVRVAPTTSKIKPKQGVIQLKKPAMDGKENISEVPNSGIFLFKYTHPHSTLKLF